MRGFRLVTSYSRPVRPALQRNLESFGLKKDQEHGYVEAPYYNGLGRYVDQFDESDIGSGTGIDTRIGTLETTLKETLKKTLKETHTYHNRKRN